MINKIWCWIKGLFRKPLVDRDGYLEADEFLRTIEKANIKFNKEHPELDRSSPFYDQDSENRELIKFLSKLK